MLGASDRKHRTLAVSDAFKFAANINELVLSLCRYHVDIDSV